MGLESRLRPRRHRRCDVRRPFQQRKSLKGPHIANIVEIEEEGEGDDLAMGLGLGALFITFALYNWIGVHGLLDAAWARETAGSEWLLMLWFGPMVIPWGMAVGSVAVSAKKHTFITETEIEEVIAGWLGIVVPLCALWAALWTYCLPYTWGIMPLWGGWWVLYILVLAPLGWGPIAAVIAGLTVKANEILSRTEPVSDEPEEETLQQGSSGESVRETQIQLNTHGASIGVDGSFGPQTHGAVTAFQEKVGLEVNGVVGPSTA
ncbi:MAG TPA: hypothetical protein EYQ80_02775, partial [Candidatus Poseidoniales archaeon]|nr:hypothetical protein [Candidatus Poseidoniales archaeon]